MNIERQFQIIEHGRGLNNCIPMWFCIFSWNDSSVKLISAINRCKKARKMLQELIGLTVLLKHTSCFVWFLTNLSHGMKLNYNSLVETASWNLKTFFLKLRDLSNSVLNTCIISVSYYEIGKPSPLFSKDGRWLYPFRSSWNIYSLQKE